MSLLGRLRPTVLRNFRPKAGDSHASEPFLSPGKNPPHRLSIQRDAPTAGTEEETRVLGAALVSLPLYCVDMVFSDIYTM